LRDRSGRSSVTHSRRQVLRPTAGLPPPPWNRRAVPLRRHFAIGRNGKVDVITLEHAARDVRHIRLARAEPLDRRFVITERSQKLPRELVGIEQFGSEPGYGFFDLDDVHDVSCA
jgi:hypothetical protein